MPSINPFHVFAVAVLAIIWLLTKYHEDDDDF